MTPNGVTAVSAVCSAAGIALIAVGPFTWQSGMLIALLLVLGYALDSADGQLARLRGGGSLAGEWLDHVVDAVKMASLHLAVLVGWWRSPDVDDPWLILPVAYEMLAVTFFFTIVLTDQMRRLNRGSTQMRLAGEGSSSILYSVAVLPTEYGILALLFVLWGTDLFLGLYAVLLVLNVLFLCVAMPKWFREVRAMNPSE
ncbi:CDP-alcohol phosphatidyltransferase family protein [Arthrobacter tecti]